MFKLDNLQVKACDEFIIIHYMVFLKNKNYQIIKAITKHF
jgi:hypothetical protein